MGILYWLLIQIYQYSNSQILITDRLVFMQSDQQRYSTTEVGIQYSYTAEWVAYCVFVRQLLNEDSLMDNSTVR